MDNMTNEQREELVALLRTWLATPSGPLPADMISRMTLHQRRSEAVQGARYLLKQLEVELGGPLQ